MNGFEKSCFTRERFEAYFQDIIDDLTHCPDPRLTDAYNRMHRILTYHAIGGKLNRGMSVVESFLVLSQPSQRTAESISRAAKLGWALEISQAFFLIADDIMDRSESRRGKLCWYKVPGIGLDAINDVFLLEQLVYKLLRKECSNQPYYIEIFHLFHDVIFHTSLGQALDLLTSPDVSNNKDSTSILSNFTVERYETIVTHKTAFYSLYWPVAIALILVGIQDSVAHSQAKEILLKLGNFFQIQDDYLDCYGDPKVTGKIGTDIEENKCTWLIVRAKQVCSKDQLSILEANYGRKNPENVAAVKTVYEEINMKKEFHKYEEESFAALQDLFAKVNPPLDRKLFDMIALKIYKRIK